MKQFRYVLKNKPEAATEWFDAKGVTVKNAANYSTILNCSYGNDWDIEYRDISFRDYMEEQRRNRNAQSSVL